MKHSLALLLISLGTCMAALHFGRLEYTRVSSFKLPRKGPTDLFINDVNGRSNYIFFQGTDLHTQLGSLSFYICRNGIMRGSIHSPGGRRLMTVQDGDMLIFGKDFEKLHTKERYCPSQDLKWVQDLDAVDIFVVIVIDRTLDFITSLTSEVVVRDTSPSLALKDQKRDPSSESTPLKSNGVGGASEAPGTEEMEHQWVAVKGPPFPKSVGEKNSMAQKSQGVKRPRSPEPAKPIKEPKLDPAFSIGIDQLSTSNSLVDRIRARLDRPLTDSKTGRYIPTVNVCFQSDFPNTSFIGKGNYGRVYKAWWNDKDVAIKVLKYGSESELGKIRNEDVLLAELDHPSIPKLHCIYVEDDFVGLVMEYRGNSINSRTLGQEERRDVVKQLVDVLEYLHSNQIYHCDIHMENITFSGTCSDPVVSLIDFGAAWGGDPEDPAFGGNNFLRGLDDSNDWRGVAAVLDRLGCCRKFSCDPYAKDLRDKVGNPERSKQWTYRNGNIGQIKDHCYFKD